MAVPDQATRTIENSPLSITATTEAEGVLVQVNQGIPDAVLQLLLYGTYTGVTVLVRGRLAGMWDSSDASLGTYAPISAINVLTGAAAGTAGTFALTNSSTNNLRFTVQPYDWIEVYASALTTGSVSVAKSITPPSTQSPPILDVTVSGVSGTTGEFSTSLTLPDNATLLFGTGLDISMTWNGTNFVVSQAAANSAILWGAAGAGIDHVFYGDTSGYNMTWDQSADALLFADNAKLVIGTGSDIVFLWDATDLLVSQATADSIIKWGVSGAGINHVFYGDTATRDMTWDQTNDQLLFADNAKLAIGSGGGAAGDITFSWNATKMLVAQLTANSAIDWGVDGAGIDMVLYGDTASASVTWDQSADTLIFAGVAKAQFQTIAAATGTAIPVTHSGSFPITQNGAETNTLAIPTYLGQWLSIFVDTDTSGARVITSAQRINQAGNTIITLTEVGDFIKLEAITIGGALRWQVVSNDGAALS